MNTYLYLKSRNDAFNATAKYENGTLTVLAGSKINICLTKNIRNGGISGKYRKNPQYVDSSGVVLQDCTFRSPSTAALFVTGTSRNGYIVWKDNQKVNLKELEH